MSTCHFPAISFALVLLLAVAPVTSQAQQLGTDADWLPTQFHPRGVDGDVLWSVIYCGTLYISGDFQFLGDQEVNGLARWDGTSWQKVPGNTGGGPLTVFDNKLAVVRGSEVQGIYLEIQVGLWDGSTWETLPSLFSLGSGGDVRAVQAHAGNLVLGGNIAIISLDESIHSAARWDGVAWQGLGGDGLVQDLTVHDGDLVAAWLGATTRVDRLIGNTWTTLGGTFPTEGTSPYGFSALATYGSDLLAAKTGPSTSEYEIWRWDGTAWSLFETSSTGRAVYDMIVQGTDLYVGTSWEGVRLWDGSAWSTLGSSDTEASTLAWNQGELVAGGRNSVASWNGTAWGAMGDQSGEAPRGHIMAIHPHNGDLIVAGSLTLPGEGQFVAAWNGASWQGLGSGPPNMQRALTEYDGKLISAGGTDVWQWTGARWRNLGGANGTIYALTVYQGALIAAGTFTELGGVAASGVAAWDGTSWSPLGLGLDGGGYVATVWNNLLVIGGNFGMAGGNNRIQHLGSWDGSYWNDLEPSGTNPLVITGPVTAVAEYDGDLVAGGSFMNGTEKIASWNGNDWSALEGGLDRSPEAMISFQGHLFASGYYLSVAGGVPVNHIAAWNGVSWMAMGNGLTDPINQSFSNGWTMTLHEGDLWIGGNFRSAGSGVSFHLARWNLSTLSANREPVVHPATLLGPGFPNPFEATSRMELQLAEAGRVRVTVFDVQGRPVTSLLDEWLAPGRQLLEWNPRGAGGKAVGAGIYFIRVQSPGRTDSRRVVYAP